MLAFYSVSAFGKENAVGGRRSRSLMPLRQKTAWLKLAAARVVFRITRLHFMVSESKDKKFVLIGEKGGWQARDNAFRLFEYLQSSGRPDVFFVARKTNEDISTLRKFGSNVVEYNSIRHYYILLRSKVLVLNDGYSDVCPRLPRILEKMHEPFYYLRHGILRYKKGYFSSGHYYGRILRFGSCTRGETELVENRMMPKHVERQLEKIQAYLYLIGSDIDPFDLRNLQQVVDQFRAVARNPAAPQAVATLLNPCVKSLPRLGEQIGFPMARIAPFGFPRHDSLLAKASVATGRANMIVLFLTWREYWLQQGSDEQLRAQPLYRIVREIVDDPRIIEFVEAHDLTIGVYIHQKMSAYRTILAEDLHPRIQVINDRIDFREMIAGSVGLVTDYSSVSLDFCLVGRPVIFYQFDQESYDAERGDFTDSNNVWVGEVVTDLESVVTAIRSLFDPGRAAKAEAYSKALRSDYPYLGRSCETIGRAIDTLPPRVTFICYNIYGVGGTVRSVTNSANYLFDKGYHVEIFSLKRTSAIPSLGLHPSIRVTSITDATDRRRTIKWSLERLLARIPSVLFNRHENQYRNVSILHDLKLIWLLRNCTADILIPTIPSLAAAAIRYSRSRTKVLVQEHMFFGAHHPSIRRMIEKIYPQADGILTLTHEDAEEYDRATGLRTYVVPNGVGVRPDSERETPEIRRVVALGRLDEQKQFDLLIVAFGKVADDFPEWRLFIYGAGREYANLKSLVADLGLRNRVFLKGVTMDSGKVLDQADICAVSSSYEGFGMVYIEAYASGKPVVSFDIEKGPKEIMIDGETGLKARPLDVDDYAAKLAMLMASEPLRKTMGENGRRFLMRTYELERVGRMLEDAIMATAQRCDEGNAPREAVGPQDRRERRTNRGS